VNQISQAPSVTSAATTTQIPLNPSHSMTRFPVEGAPPLAPGAFPLAQIRLVSPDYFRTMGIGLLQGRSFERKDIDDPTGFFIVNQAFARRYLAGRNPLGANVILGVLSPSRKRFPSSG
jgi:hypothetical protein